MNDINFGTVALRVLDILILQLFKLPLKVYKNVLTQLSNAKSENSEESNLSSDFPIYIWFANIWNALIILSYPIGIIMAIIASNNRFTGGFGTFMLGLVFTYFLPLLLGWTRELMYIMLKILLYLNIISKK